MLKDGNEDVNHVVPDNKYDIWEIEFTTQRKDEQVALVNSGVNKNLVQISKSRTNVEANAQYIVFTMMRNNGGNRIHVDVTYVHMDNESFHSETSFQKWKYVLQGRIVSDRETINAKKS